MSGKNVKDFFKAVFHKNEDEFFPFRFDKYMYHTFKKTYVCRVQVIGTRNALYFTASEIIENERILSNFSSIDAVLIKEYLEKERQEKSQMKLVEADLKKGTVTFKNGYGEEQKHAEKNIVLDPAIQERISSTDAAEISYRVGFKDGVKSVNEKPKGKFANKILSRLPFTKK
jgi:hypothetical protein